MPKTIDLENWDEVEPRSVFVSREATLEMVVRLAYNLPGNIIEFGVAKGGSTRIIRRIATECEKRFPDKKTIYACDSWKGLSEKFENAEVGTFAGEPPKIKGVNLVEGYFEDSLTDELAATVGPVAFASLDADLYSSTLCVLNWLTPLLSSGSLLLFDEFIGEKESEKRAFEDWSQTTGVQSLKIADFIREPSGWGSAVDRRALFQIIDKEAISRQSQKKKSVLQKAVREASRIFRSTS